MADSGNRGLRQIRVSIEDGRLRIEFFADLNETVERIAQVALEPGVAKQLVELLIKKIQEMEAA